MHISREKIRKAPAAWMWPDFGDDKVNRDAKTMS